MTENTGNAGKAIDGHIQLPWDVFVGNANGRGLVRIEQANTGKHVASFPRSAEGEATAMFIVAALNEQSESQGQTAPQTRVKRLDWVRNGWVEAFAHAEKLGLWYSISPEKPVRGAGEAPFSCYAIRGAPTCISSVRDALGVDFGSLDAAKAAAQADYEARILSALEPAPRVAALEAENARLREALEPFSQVAFHDIGEDEADQDIFRPISQQNARAPVLLVGHFRSAYTAITPKGEA